MTRARLDEEAVGRFIAENAGWAREGEAIARTFEFDHYGAGIAFCVHVGFAAEKADHHPDLHVGWCKVKVVWTTHDAGGITARDVELARTTDAAYRRAR